MNAPLLLTLAALWVAGLAGPLLWWRRQRQLPDLWEALPLPAALLDPTGRTLRRTGPDSPADLAVDIALPAAGRTCRAVSRDGSPLALTGLVDGALAIALPLDPLRDRRDRLLADLGSRLAHDLNTPLAAVLGHLELIEYDPTSEQARSSVAICQQEITRAHNLARDLLTLTRLRAGTARRNAEHAGALAEEAASALLPLADELHANLTVQTATDTPVVDVAADDLLRALRNLLSNALHHGLGQRRQVRLCVDATTDAVTFRIQDSGPGLTPEQLEELSEPFVRGTPDNHTAGHTGSGLGLAIAQEVVRAHGGELVSTQHGGWSELAFTLARTA